MGGGGGGGGDQSPENRNPQLVHPFLNLVYEPK